MAKYEGIEQSRNVYIADILHALATDKRYNKDSKNWSTLLQEYDAKENVINKSEITKQSVKESFLRLKRK